MLRRIVLATLLAGLLVGIGTPLAQAQQPTGMGQPATTSSGWSFDITPYVWFATINAGLKLNLPPAIGGTVSTDTSIGFGELLSRINFGAMVAADARYDRFVILTDFLYLNVGDVASQINSVNVPNRPNIPISTTVQTGVSLRLSVPIWTLAGGYTVAQGNWGNFDAIVGFRYLSLNARVNHSLALTLAGPRGNSATFETVGGVTGSTDIWNGIAGFRGRIRISDSALFVPYYFDIGAGGSNLTWQIASGLGYQFGWGDVSLIYRYLSFDQGSDSVLQSLKVRGPMIALNISF
ncbi:MAG TPA: hypothetical protein VK822_15280 [Acetobacteraceae bacterium]|nr:hypothetical protein [Acetobacteraceae bacterium]